MGKLQRKIPRKISFFSPCFSILKKRPNEKLKYQFTVFISVEMKKLLILAFLLSAALCAHGAVNMEITPGEYDISDTDIEFDFTITWGELDAVKEFRVPIPKCPAYSEYSECKELYYSEVQLIATAPSSGQNGCTLFEGEVPKKKGKIVCEINDPNDREIEYSVKAKNIKADEKIGRRKEDLWYLEIHGEYTPNYQTKLVHLRRPDVEITNPRDGQTLNGTINFTAMETENSLTPEGVFFRAKRESDEKWFFFGDDKDKSDGWSVEFDSSKLKDEPHKLYAIPYFTDPQNFEGDWEQIRVIIDSTAPASTPNPSPTPEASPSPDPSTSPEPDTTPTEAPPADISPTPTPRVLRKPKGIAAVIVETGQFKNDISAISAEIVYDNGEPIESDEMIFSVVIDGTETELTMKRAEGNLFSAKLPETLKEGKHSVTLKIDEEIVGETQIEILGDLTGKLVAWGLLIIIIAGLSYVVMYIKGTLRVADETETVRKWKPKTETHFLLKKNKPYQGFKKAEPKKEKPEPEEKPKEPVKKEKPIEKKPEKKPEPKPKEAPAPKEKPKPVQEQEPKASAPEPEKKYGDGVSVVKVEEFSDGSEIREIKFKGKRKKMINFRH